MWIEIVFWRGVEICGGVLGSGGIENVILEGCGYVRGVLGVGD